MFTEMKSLRLQHQRMYVSERERERESKREREREREKHEMIGVLGPDSALVRLHWVGDNLD